MLTRQAFDPYICARCLSRQAQLLHRTSGNGAVPRQPFSAQSDRKKAEKDGAQDKQSPSSSQPDTGRMSERLAQMTEQTLEEGGTGAQKAIREAGFSEEVRQKLEARIQDTKFRSDNPAAFAQVNMPACAGEGTRNTAGASSWTGDESVGDAALRMLNDAHKPLRGAGSPRIPRPSAPTASVDLRIHKSLPKSGPERLASARDRTSRYALSQDPSLSEKERDQMRKTLKERFTPGARPMPATVQGLGSLANERIEDAIARGQFKNIPRGRGTNVERDHNADSPFLDTTEYFMNKMIQKQDIVPPWIEKQQELVKAAATFRARLRNDWKRHAARVIASKGGSLEDQVRRAEAYAEAEEAANPPTPKREAFSEIDSEGRLSQLTIMEIPVTQANSSEGTRITVTESLASESPDGAGDAIPKNSEKMAEQVSSTSPFRDPAWLALEEPYHNLAVRELNNQTRSYNLQAPDLAKKPYFSLGRELRTCYSDVAPQLANEIRERARRPERIRVEVIGHRPGGVLEKFSTDKVKVYDSTKPKYGFRDFWRDLWSGEMARV